MRALLRLLLASLRLALVFAIAGCAAVPRPAEIPRDVRLDRAYAKLPMDQAGPEAVRVLSDYLRVDTTNPPGRELAGVQFLAGILARENIAHEIVEHGPGRASLIATLPGSGSARPLCLLSHVDVVPAEEGKWPAGRGPLSGAVVDGFLWGRGALDMKGLGALELLTMVWLKRLELPLARGVVLLAVAGEETDNLGARTMVEHHWNKIGCSHAINEGGLGIHDLVFEGQTVYAVSVAEKGVLWLRMTARGEAGHGSTPAPNRAPDRLVRALAAIAKRKPETKVHRSIYELLAAVGRNRGGPTGFVLQRPSLVDLFAMGKLEGNPVSHAGLVDTVNLTGLSGMNEPNVIPSEVFAVLDCRLLPGARKGELIAELERIVDDDDVKFTILQHFDATESEWRDDELFAAIVRHAEGGRSHVVAGPVLSPGFTDSTFLRRVGVRAYGFVPFELTQDDFRGFHGKDERVSVANVVNGLRTLFRVVVDFTVDRSKLP